MGERRGTFIDRVLDGHARIDQLEAEVEAWAAGPRSRPLHELLGLGAPELELVATTPDSLRYLLHARRFGRDVAIADLLGQRRVRDHATLLASDIVDPFELAELETWRTQVDLLTSDDRLPARA